MPSLIIQPSTFTFYPMQHNKSSSLPSIDSWAPLYSADVVVPDGPYGSSSTSSTFTSSPPVTTEVSPTHTNNGIHDQPSIDTYCVQVKEHDVLFGRGSRTNEHQGNLKYRRYVQEYKPAYKALDAVGKKALIQVVVCWVELQGGRFLACDKTPEGHGHYYLASDKEVHEKVSQALREDHTPEGRALKKARLTHKE